MSVFEPIYGERTKLISQRSAVDDAEAVLAKEGPPFLTVSEALEESRFGIHPVYPGLSQEQMTTVDYHSNMKSIQEDELTNYLWTLLSLDPLHEENEEARRYYTGTKIYNAFLKERYSYMEQFNQHILKSNKSAHATARG